jgi:hypothetical protein
MYLAVIYICLNVYYFLVASRQSRGPQGLYNSGSQVKEWSFAGSNAERSESRFHCVNRMAECTK